MQNVKITKITKISKRKRYELEVADNHNFFVNGILKHNCRCVTIVKNGKAECYTRKGNKYTTLNKLKDAIELNCQKLGITSIVFDGELCIVDEHGDEDFSAIQKVWNKKEYTIPNPKYKIFDVLTVEEFDSQVGTMGYKERNELLGESLLSVENGNEDTYFAKLFDWQPILGVVKSAEHLEEEMKKSATLGWEGLMIRKGGYTGKRSYDLLKVKKFNDAEYVVTGVEIGMFQVVEEGKETEIECVTRLNIMHKGNHVGVGSGPKLWQRKEWFASPSTIIGKTITVKYFELSTNSDGAESLRFPVLKAVHGQTREV